MIENRHAAAALSPKVVWSEGMYIGPHHFQLQSRYFEDSIQFVAASLWFEPWGLTGLELDTEALENNTVSLLHARGIFPDGLPFDTPQTDALPEARSIANLVSPAEDAVTLLLGVPLRQIRGPNCAFGDSQPQFARHIAETRVMPDQNSGLDDRPIQIARKRLKLLLESEPSEGFATLPLARLRRDGAGHFRYDPDFVPPVLQIQASPRLMLLARRLIGILDEKSAAIAQRADPGAEFSTNEIPKFWLLHAIHSANATLRHLLAAKQRHPEDLFLELSRLAGALCTFTVGSHPLALPAYRHRDPSACFEALDRHIREHLEITLPANCISIPLKHAGGCFYEGEIVDRRCLGRSRWVFAIHAPIAEADLMVRVPQLVKLCSPQFVRELVKRALPGLPLRHLAVPPAAISSSADKQYFAIGRAGPCWDHMVQTGRVGVYIPGDIPDPEAEILVVLERA
ncbi:MAG TPA: type VI secretion system baseplate subunit TssK [Candidatus Acidoferrales bacterium]|nr:type VI secretion system baseplate subunit TssK [Candidatus Acidoferrales bacterium]